MFGRLFSRDHLLSRAELARRIHERWLTRALTTAHPLPRIPVRPVADGGFAPLMATPHGRRWAESWWHDTLDAPDPIGDDPLS